MKKLDLYLIKKFLGPFVVVFFIVVFTLSLQFIWQYINELVGKGLSFGVIMEFLGWAACGGNMRRARHALRGDSAGPSSGTR